MADKKELLKLNRNKEYKDYEKLGSKESVELLHKQISHSTSDKTKPHYNLGTLRDYVEAIYSSLNKYQQKQEKKYENNNLAEDWSHGFCGVFGLFLTFSANGMSDS